MRVDMKHVITQRGSRGEKYDGVRRRINTNDLEKLEQLPEREGMRSRCQGWRDRFFPETQALLRFLRSRLGCRWDDVYSEICQQADFRSRRGRRLREALEWSIETNDVDLYCRPWRIHYDAFYVDEEGILRERKGTPWSSRWNRRKLDPDRCDMMDGTRYARINGCWFQVWYEIAERRFWHTCPITEERYVVYSNREYIDRQKQLSKKELKAIGFSNDPDFKWWRDQWDKIT